VCRQCGYPNQPCCAGGSCNYNQNSAMTCSNNTCVQCGDPGEPCCGGYRCNGPNTCVNSTCQAKS
jgi:hypothetical protein